MRSRKSGALSRETQLVSGQVPGARAPTLFLYSLFLMDVREGTVLRVALSRSSKHGSQGLTELIRIPVPLLSDGVDLAKLCHSASDFSSAKWRILKKFTNQGSLWEFVESMQRKHTASYLVQFVGSTHKSQISQEGNILACTLKKQTFS